MARSKRGRRRVAGSSSASWRTSLLKDTTSIVLIEHEDLPESAALVASVHRLRGLGGIDGAVADGKMASHSSVPIP